jgi:hypothetical protein
MESMVAWLMQLVPGRESDYHPQMPRLWNQVTFIIYYVSWLAIDGSGWWKNVLKR